MVRELYPCPFCGGASLGFAASVPDRNGLSEWHIKCRGCSASGGWGKDLDDAEALWNTRIVVRATDPAVDGKEERQG